MLKEQLEQYKLWCKENNRKNNDIKSLQDYINFFMTPKCYFCHEELEPIEDEKLELKNGVEIQWYKCNHCPTYAAVYRRNGQITRIKYQYVHSTDLIDTINLFANVEDESNAKQ